MSSSQMWISYDRNKKKLRIPVLPEKVEISFPEKNDNVYIYGIGDVTIKKSPGAFVLKFSSFFPKDACQGSIKKPTEPQKCAEFLKKVMALDKCARFTYTGGAHPITTNCTIKYDEYEQGGDPGTIYYTLTVTEYKKITVRKLDVRKNRASVSSSSGRTSTKSDSKTYTVVSGDCLWNIAKKYYGSGAQYTKIYNANKGVIGSNPNLIYPGQVLAIP